MVGIIVKKYEHFNRSFGNWDSKKGKYISSKKQYQEEMAKGGFVSFEGSEQRAEEARKKIEKPYDKLSDEKMKFLHQVKDMADKNGNIEITGRFVEGLKEHGVLPKKDIDYKNLPSNTKDGGFI